MSDTVPLWALRVLWVAVAVAAADPMAEALEGTDPSYEATATIGALTLWGITLVATLVPLPSTLTVVRIAVPAGVVATAWALAVAGLSVTGVIAVSTAAAAAAVSLTAPVGDRFVDGASYGNERRMPLRPPAALVVGPIPVAWAVTVAGTAAGPLLLADGRWVTGAVVGAIGVPGAVAAARSLYFLTTRVVVFVPNGLVLADRAVLTDPVLFHRSTIVSIGAALADTTAEDLTAGAPGLAVELRLDRPTGVVTRRRGGQGAVTEVTALIFSPSSPGALVTEAQRRRLGAS